MQTQLGQVLAALQLTWTIHHMWIPALQELQLRARAGGSTLELGEHVARVLLTALLPTLLCRSCSLHLGQRHFVILTCAAMY